MKEILVLDGYNVINALPELRMLASADFEAAREKLVDWMAEYRGFRGVEVLIVFDAHLTPQGRERHETMNGVEVVFTREKMTADQYIEKMIHTLSMKRKVMVVTNDWTEQLMVLGGGAVRVSVRELELDLNEARRRIAEKTSGLGQTKEFLAGRIDRKTMEKLERMRKR